MNSIPEKRVCSKCKEEFPLTDEFFPRGKKYAYGLKPRCKGCDAQALKDWRARNPDKVRAQGRRHYQNHREQRIAEVKRWYQEHKSERAEYARKRREENPEKFREWHRNWQARHPGYSAQQRRKGFALNPERYRAYRRKRRALAHGRDGQFSPEIIEGVLKAHTDSKGRLRCARCGKVIKGAYHLDHFIPLIKGGTNDPGNFRIMHPKCNQTKSGKMPIEIGMLI